MIAALLIAASTPEALVVKPVTSYTEARVVASSTVAVTPVALANTDPVLFFSGSGTVTVAIVEAVVKLELPATVEALPDVSLCSKYAQ